jgi:hypothetical protein
MPYFHAWLRMFATALLLMLTHSAVRAESLVFYASASGKRTLDADDKSLGNPFASALIEILARPSLKLSELPGTLRRLTIEKSGTYQSPDVPASIAQENYLLVPAKDGERRIALVLVVSDYQTAGVVSLPGAIYDAHRIELALKKAGFQTEVAPDLGLHSMKEKLAEFRSRSIESDAAVIYTTGHGVEVEGTVYLMPGDYPVTEGDTALRQQALPVTEIAASLKAKQVNLLFYGGCRDNPF